MYGERSADEQFLGSRKGPKAQRSAKGIMCGKRFFRGEAASGRELTFLIRSMIGLLHLLDHTKLLSFFSFFLPKNSQLNPKELKT
jgi:hypothetical protein